MLHFVVGTKAQLIKVAPVMAEATSRGIPYNFIYTGQHRETMDALRENFRIKDPDITLYEGKDITSIPKMLLWIIQVLWKTLTARKEIFRGDRKGIVLIHGDTFSTILGALMGKVAGLRVGHIESGLRSFNVFHPFPEELTRLGTFALSDEYFCPGAWAVNNLNHYRGKKVDTRYNTLLDALRLAREHFDQIDIDIPKERYCVVTIHRFENIFKRDALEANLVLVEKAAAKMRTVFILHPVTKERLENFGLMKRLEDNPNLDLRPRYDYFGFMKLVYYSEFLISDGGSNQEECCYMGKPCILLRKVTERQEGLGANVVVSQYDPQIFSNFLERYESFKTEALIDTVSPSRIILDAVAEYV